MIDRFLSTPSARRATGHRGHGERCRVFLSTPSARRATFKRDYSLLTTIFLSTPSARRATTTMWTNSSQASISIHALREEGDRRGQQARGVTKVFLSTPSARRATWKGLLVMSVQTFLSTPSARRATAALPSAECLEDISIHALREEGD